MRPVFSGVTSSLLTPTLPDQPLPGPPPDSQWIVPIPGTRRRERLEENAGAAAVALSADQVADLNAVAARIGVQGNRYNDLHMGLVGR
jgi:hypothetical protein